LKPEDAPTTKDHDYGFGLPAVGTMVGRIATPKAPVDISTLIVPMMIMMMLAMIMR
jgi:serine protease AprX